MYVRVQWISICYSGRCSSLLTAHISRNSSHTWTVRRWRKYVRYTHTDIACIVLWCECALIDPYCVQKVLLRVLQEAALELKALGAAVSQSLQALGVPRWLLQREVGGEAVAEAKERLHVQAREVAMTLQARRKSIQLCRLQELQRQRRLRERLALYCRYVFLHTSPHTVHTISSPGPPQTTIRDSSYRTMLQEQLLFCGLGSMC